MRDLLVVGAGGCLGALARFALAGLVQRNCSFTPAGTMAVNVLGCLLIGAVMALIADYRALSLQMQYFLVTGILGGFTTFSAFAYETVQLLHSGAVGLALLNIAGNVVVGCAAVWAGHALVRFLWS